MRRRRQHIRIGEWVWVWGEVPRVVGVGVGRGDGSSVWAGWARARETHSVIGRLIAYSVGG